jgi:hypothetical protein
MHCKKVKFSIVELSDLYSLPNIVRLVKSRRMRWAGHVARVGEGRGVHRVLVGKPEGKRPLGRPRHRWEDNIKMDLQEVGGDYAAQKNDINKNKPTNSKNLFEIFHQNIRGLN